MTSRLDLIEGTTSVAQYRRRLSAPAAAGRPGRDHLVLGLAVIAVLLVISAVTAGPAVGEGADWGAVY